MVIVISNEENPIEWAQFIYELSDAHEHLGELIDKLVEKGKDAPRTFASASATSTRT